MANLDVKLQKDMLTWISKGEKATIDKSSGERFIGNGSFLRKVNCAYINESFLTEINCVKSLQNDSLDAWKRVEVREDAGERLLGKKKIKCKKFKTNNSFCYVDEKYLKYFDSKAEYRIKNEKNAVLVFENNSLTGIIMPFLVKE